MHPELHSSTHVFLRDDTVKRPLQPPYRGPFQVLRRSGKFFTIDVKGKHENVSIERLKPAFLEQDSAAGPVKKPFPPTKALPVSTGLANDQQHALPSPELRKTRSGRHVRWPARYVDFFEAG